MIKLVYTDSVCDLDHAEADDLVAELEALFKFQDYLALAVLVVLQVHDGVVQGGVELLSDGLYLVISTPLR